MPWSLLLRHLLARPVRTALTFLSLVIAFFLVCFLKSVVGALGAGVEAASQSRLIVQSAVSLFVNLPVSYQSKIDGVVGVERTCKLQWFGGYYQDPANFFAQFAVDADRLLGVYPEIVLVEGSEAQFLRQRNACLIGEELADSFGWRVGDTVPIIGGLYTRVDGSPWTFLVAGIYRPSSANVDGRTLWFHYEYLEQSLENGAAEGPDGAGVYVLSLARGADVTRVMGDIDRLFENGPQRVQTTTESEFQRQFVSMLGSVPTLLGSIGGGVLFAILLATLNTMLMAGRERTRSMGILKALGYPSRAVFALLIGESLILCLLGGMGGVGVALATSEGMGSFFGGFGIPGYGIGLGTAAMGMGLALLVGLVAGIAPAIAASRMRVVDALGAEH
ncbi:MAG: FtsX-like permease family protein [Planctomycetaceae bacterium]|nr:FtsX-like permease family protein [Planctomycetaceae bacterium]